LQQDPPEDLDFDLDRLMNGLEYSPEVHVTLSKTESMKFLGVKITGISENNVVLVEKVGNRGLLATWNLTHPSQEQVRSGDIIMSVNGKCDIEGMMSQINDKALDTLHIVLKHPNFLYLP